MWLSALKRYSGVPYKWFTACDFVEGDAISPQEVLVFTLQSPCWSPLTYF